MDTGLRWKIPTDATTNQRRSRYGGNARPHSVVEGPRRRPGGDFKGRSPALPLPRLGQVPLLGKRPVSRAGSLLPHQPFPEPWAGSGGLPGDPEVLFIDTSSPGGGEGQGCSWSRHAVSPGGEGGAVSPRRQVLHLCVPRLAPGAVLRIN